MLQMITAGLAGCALMATTTPAARETRLDIITPCAFQVFQRNTAGMAQIPVRVSSDLNAARIEARITQISDGSVVYQWRQLMASSDEGVYETSLEAPAGGWYAVQVRALDAQDAVIAESAVERVGVGEVFICAGQSNSANFGEARLKSTDDRVVSFDCRTWSRCEDPQKGADGGGGSPWPVLGDLLARHLDVPVAFASVGVGGTSVNFWQPGEEGFARLQAAISALGGDGFRAVLWHQGESDAGGGMAAADYESRLTNTITQSRKLAGRDFPWFIAKVSFCPDHWDQHPEMRDAIRSAQQSIWDRGIAFPGPDTDTLRAPKYRSQDRIHFSELGLRTHAERWFALIWTKLFECEHRP